MAMMEDDSTWATMAPAVNEDGTCPKHPHIKLREHTPDGYVIQKDSCEECDKEFYQKQTDLKARRKELDRQLQALDDTPNDDDEDDSLIHARSIDERHEQFHSDLGKYVSHDDISNLRDTLTKYKKPNERTRPDGADRNPYQPQHQPPPQQHHNPYHGNGRNGRNTSSGSNGNNGNMGHNPRSAAPSPGGYHHRHSSVPPMMDDGYTRPNFSIESLAQQMNRMQQMQDWLLQQKEQEMQLLRNKVEQQQKELLQKEVDLALLREKLSQQENRMQQELKMLELSMQRKGGRSKPKEIHIGELHVQVGNVDKNKNGEVDPSTVQAATAAATKAAISGAEKRMEQHEEEERRQPIRPQQQQQQRHQQPPPQVERKIMDDMNTPNRTTMTSGNKVLAMDNKVVTVESKKAPAPSKKMAPMSPTRAPAEVTSPAPISPVSTKTAPAPKQKLPLPKPTPPATRGGTSSQASPTASPVIVNANVGRPPQRYESIGDSGAVMAAIHDESDSFAQPSRSLASEVEDFDDETQETKEPEEPNMDDAFLPRKDPPKAQDNQPKEFTFVPPHPSGGMQQSALGPMDDDEDDDDETPVSAIEPMDASTSWPAPNPNLAVAANVKPSNQGPPPASSHAQGLGMARKEPLQSVQEGGELRPDPAQSLDGFRPNSIPKNLTVDNDAQPEVPNTEEVTITSFDHSFLPNHYKDHDDGKSVGNTVASSTYGEDRQKVVNQTLLDPYGDKGRYSGIVLRSTGMPHGLGRMMYEDDGRTYEGDWRHGRWHGYGRATFANGDSYEGEYRFDQRHGRGIYCWSDGRVYDGAFSEDKRHGKGTFKWPDGATYEGDFVQGQREGHGRYTFSDGGYYVGSWVDGRYEGFGECHWEDGRTYKGEWKAGMAHGQGVETYPDGRVRHDGQWISDEPVRGK